MLLYSSKVPLARMLNLSLSRKMSSCCQVTRGGGLPPAKQWRAAVSPLRAWTRVEDSRMLGGTVCVCMCVSECIVHVSILRVEKINLN